MAEHVIYINATEAEPFPPHLYDDEGNSSRTLKGDEAFITFIEPGDIIFWKAKGDIPKIDKILQEGKVNLFSSVPIQKDDVTWMGIVKKILPKDAEESYTIFYTVEGHPKPFKQDPKLKFGKRK